MTHMGRSGWTTAFDADDTLWHTERAFRATQGRVLEMLAAHAPAEDLAARLLAAERRNLGIYGFGVKGFVLSLIEAAVEATDGRVDGRAVGDILALGREMLAHPIELMPHAREAVEAARAHGAVLLVTKGDLIDQERKLAQSGLGDLFDAVEIVSQKTPAVYARVFARHGGAERAAMVGDSARSDVLPALEAGAVAVHVPQPTPWEVERADLPDAHPRLHRLADLGGLPPLLAALAG